MLKQGKFVWRQRFPNKYQFSKTGFLYNGQSHILSALLFQFHMVKAFSFKKACAHTHTHYTSGFLLLVSSFFNEFCKSVSNRLINISLMLLSYSRINAGFPLTLSSPLLSVVFLRRWTYLCLEGEPISGWNETSFSTTEDVWAARQVEAMQRSKDPKLGRQLRSTINGRASRQAWKFRPGLLLQYRSSKPKGQSKPERK